MDGDGAVGVNRNRQTIKRGPNAGTNRFYYVDRLRILGTHKLFSRLTIAIHLLCGIMPFKAQPKEKNYCFLIQYSEKSADTIPGWLYRDAELNLPCKKQVWECIRNVSRGVLARYYQTPTGGYNERAKKGTVNTIHIYASLTITQACVSL